MSNKSAPTQRQRAERARRQAMGIAVIQRPLNYIRSRTSPSSEKAFMGEIAANIGNGTLVKLLARSL